MTEQKPTVEFTVSPLRNHDAFRWQAKADGVLTYGQTHEEALTRAKNQYADRFKADPKRGMPGRKQEMLGYMKQEPVGYATRIDKDGLLHYSVVLPLYSLSEFEQVALKI